MVVNKNVLLNELYVLFCEEWQAWACTATQCRWKQQQYGEYFTVHVSAPIPWQWDATMNIVPSACHDSHANKKKWNNNSFKNLHVQKFVIIF